MSCFLSRFALIAVFMGSVLGAHALDNASHVESNRQLVEQTVAQYLEAIRLNDLATAYRMELAAHEGRLTPLQFRQAVTASGTLRDYTILTVEMTGEQEAIVTVQITQDLPELRLPYTSERQMHWVLREGRAFHGSDSGKADENGSSG
jgi:hypothetical protein